MGAKPSRVQFNASPGHVTKVSADSKNRNKRQTTDGIDAVEERFAIPEGVFHAKLSGEKFCTINGSAFISTGDIVLSDMINKKIKLFSCTYDFMRFIEFPEPARSLCASPNLPLIYAAFPDRVRQIQVDGIKLKTCGFIKTTGHCMGVTVNKFDGKAVSLSLSDNMGQVNFLTPGGNVQLEITKDQKGENLFIRPEAMCVTRNLNLVVADKGTNSVVGLDSKGNIIFVYKGLRLPTALMCDEINFIYVAGPHCVHQLTEKGEIVKIFLTKAEIGFSPLSMCYNQQKKLLLFTGPGSKVPLFKFT